MVITIFCYYKLNRMVDVIIAGSAYPPYCLVTCDEECTQHLYHYGFIVSIIFSVITAMVALYNIVMHYINFNNPYFQSKIISNLIVTKLSC